MKELTEGRKEYINNNERAKERGTKGMNERSKERNPKETSKIEIHESKNATQKQPIECYIV